MFSNSFTYNQTGRVQLRRMWTPGDPGRRRSQDMKLPEVQHESCNVPMWTLGVPAHHLPRPGVGSRFHGMRGRASKTSHGKQVAQTGQAGYPCAGAEGRPGAAGTPGRGEDRGHPPGRGRPGPLGDDAVPQESPHRPKPLGDRMVATARVLRSSWLVERRSWMEASAWPMRFRTSERR